MGCTGGKRTGRRGECRGGMQREINNHQNRALISVVNVVPVVSHLLHWNRAFNQIQLCKELVLAMQLEEKFTTF